MGKTAVQTTTLSKDVVVQPLNCVRLFVTPWTAVRQAPLSFTVFWSLLRFMSIESVMLHCFPIYFPGSDGTGCHDLRFLNVEL